MDRQQVIESNAAALLFEIERWLQALSQYLTSEGVWLDEDSGENGENGACDVRISLHVDDDGDVTWAGCWGDPQYDNDHRGFWGSGCLSSKDNAEDIESLARELMDQALDHYFEMHDE